MNTFGKQGEHLRKEVDGVRKDGDASRKAVHAGEKTGALPGKPVSTERKKDSAAKRRPRMPDGLPVIEEVHIPEEVKAQPVAWLRMGEESATNLHLETARHESVPPFSPHASRHYFAYPTPPSISVWSRREATD